MSNTVPRIPSDPSAWSFREWNEALFEHFFCPHNGDTTPISRLVVTGEELRLAAKGETAMPVDAHEWFRKAMLHRLESSGISLCKDALRLERGARKKNAVGVPPFFAHLVVTCVAASGTASAKQPNRQFRKRLNEFLDRGKDNPSYNLTDLPRLWEMLRSWLDKAAGRGESYRRIVLTRADHLCLIGYSLELAFPSHRDQARLIELLAPCGYAANPPVVPVLERIEGSLKKFSPRFCDACADFRIAYFRHEEDLFIRPFWSAVRDAVRTGWDKDIRVKGGVRITAILRLDLDSDWKFLLSLQVSRAVECPPGLSAVAAPDFAVGECGHVVVASDDQGDFSVGNLVLSGTLPKELTAVDTRDITRAVAQGVLLFSENEGGVWLISRSRPVAGPVKALLRGHLANIFVAAVRQVGAHAQKSPSLYEGWYEAENFDAEHLVAAKFEGGILKDVLCLMDVLRPPRVDLLGSVPVEGGILGLRSALPAVVLESSAGMPTIRRDLGDPGHGGGVPLCLDPTLTGRYLLPGPPALPRDLEGGFVIEVTRNNEIVASRRFEAHSNVLSCDYLPPTAPGAWFTEGGIHPNDDFGDASRPFLGVAACLNDGEPLVTVSDGPIPLVSSVEADRPVSELAEILAALSLHKRGIPEAELLGWFRSVLGVEGSTMFDAARAWAEAGLLDVCSFRRWRMRCYFAVRPRLVCFHTRRGGVRATLAGLVPSGLFRRLEETAPSLGVTFFAPAQLSPLLPRITYLEAKRVGDLAALSSRLGLIPPARLLPLRDVGAPVEDVMTRPEPLLCNHRFAGYWNRASVSFSSRPPTDEVVLEWYRRDDAPDAYAVRAGERQVFETRSKTWGRLAAATLRGEQLIVTGATSTVVRALEGGGYLPMPLARWATLTSGISPGPYTHGEEDPGYIYFLPGREERDTILNLLWPPAIPDSFARRARWLATLVRDACKHPAVPLVVVPPTARAAFSALRDLPGCETLSSLARVPRHILPRLLALSNMCRALDTRTGGGR